jgi:hypothetical protein
MLGQLWSDLKSKHNLGLCGSKRAILAIEKNKKDLY